MKTWSRDDLAWENIFYDDEIKPVEIPYAHFPPHVEELRHAILDFSCPPLSQDDGDAGSPDRGARHIRDTAAYYASQGYAESDWQLFFRDKLFNPLQDVVSVMPGDSRR